VSRVLNLIFDIYLVRRGDCYLVLGIFFGFNPCNPWHPQNPCL